MRQPRMVADTIRTIDARWSGLWMGGVKAISTAFVVALIGFMPALPTTVPDASAETRGPRPVGIQVDAIMIDTQVEAGEITAGALQNPSGPWVVTWYRQTARLGEMGNMVVAGHVDYWDVGPAVFYNLGDLVHGDHVRVIGEDGRIYRYTVDWIKQFPGSDLTAKQLREIVGPTQRPSLTLITCGGVFDYAQGEYQSRTIVRAIRDRSPSGSTE